MNDNLNGCFYTNVSGEWNISTIKAYDVYSVGTSVDRKVDELEKEIKDLKKRLSNLATLVCTHIGKEQMEKFYKENE